MQPEWQHRYYEQFKLDQYSTTDPYPPRVFIERVGGDKSRRKRWTIVDRRPPERWKRTVYAPKLLGPFTTLDAAKAAYLLLQQAGQFDFTR